MSSNTTILYFRSNPICKLLASFIKDNPESNLEYIFSWFHELGLARDTPQDRLYIQYKLRRMTTEGVIAPHTYTHYYSKTNHGASARAYTLSEYGATQMNSHPDWQEYYMQAKLGKLTRKEVWL